MYVFMINPDGAELQYDVRHKFWPGDCDTPPVEDIDIKYIRHKGKDVPDEVLERYFSLYHGRSVNIDEVYDTIIEAWYENREVDAGESQAQQLADLEEYLNDNQ